MALFRKKPVIVEAEQWREGGIHPDVMLVAKMTRHVMVCSIDESAPGLVPVLRTARGWQAISDGDYIIRDATGNYRSCAPAEFEAQYERIL